MWHLNAMPQNISIELSIYWQIDKDIFVDDSKMNTPFLNITYRNNSDKSIYFKKISLPDRVGLPETVHGTLLQYPYSEWLNPDWRMRAESSVEMSSFFINENYKVRIGNFLSSLGVWYIVNEADTCVECETDIINDNISDIHDYIYHTKYPERFKVSSNLPFVIDDLCEESILKANRNYFVFLKPDETYTDTFNLVAFQLVKGNYTFGIEENTIPDSVWSEFIWDDSQRKYIEQNIKLPEKVGEYQLYSGAFLTNRVTVDFSKSLIDK